MKFETLNGILTFVLGVLVVAGVILALNVVFVTREGRALQSQAMLDNARLTGVQTLFNDASAYNQKYPSVELTRILQNLQARPAGH